MSGVNGASDALSMGPSARYTLNSPITVLCVLTVSIGMSYLHAVVFVSDILPPYLQRKSSWLTPPISQSLSSWPRGRGYGRVCPCINHGVRRSAHVYRSASVHSGSNRGRFVSLDVRSHASLKRRAPSSTTASPRAFIYSIVSPLSVEDSVEPWTTSRRCSPSRTPSNVPRERFTAKNKNLETNCARFKNFWQ